MLKWPYQTNRDLRSSTVGGERRCLSLHRWCLKLSPELSFWQQSLKTQGKHFPSFLADLLLLRDPQASPAEGRGGRGWVGDAQAQTPSIRQLQALQGFAWLCPMGQGHSRQFQPSLPSEPFPTLSFPNPRSHPWECLAFISLGLIPSHFLK